MLWLKIYCILYKDKVLVRTPLLFVAICANGAVLVVFYSFNIGSDCQKK
jgi:hypothetical protein